MRDLSWLQRPKEAGVAARTDNGVSSLVFLAIGAGLTLLVSECFLWTLSNSGLWYTLSMFVVPGFAYVLYRCIKHLWTNTARRWLPLLIACAFLLLNVVLLYAQIPHRLEFARQLPIREATVNRFLDDRENLTANMNKHLGGQDGELPVLVYTDSTQAGTLKVRLEAQNLVFRFTRELPALEALLHGRLRLFSSIKHEVQYREVGAPGVEHLQQTQLQENWFWIIRK